LPDVIPAADKIDLPPGAKIDFICVSRSAAAGIEADIFTKCSAAETPDLAVFNASERARSTHMPSMGVTFGR